MHVNTTAFLKTPLQYKSHSILARPALTMTPALEMDRIVHGEGEFTLHPSYVVRRAFHQWSRNENFQLAHNSGSTAESSGVFATDDKCTVVLFIRGCG